MSMSPEDRKEYNAKYYRQRIEKEKQENRYKIKCDFCDKCIINSSMNKHLKTKYCKKHYERKIERTKKLKVLNDVNNDI